MKSLIISFLFVFFMINNSFAENTAKHFISTKNAVLYLKKQDAALVLKTRDEFLLSLSEFDRASRLKVNHYVSLEQFIEEISHQTLDWSNDEINSVNILLDSINHKIKEYDLNLPEEIYLIKTTGNEEGQAAYCRQNAIILPQGLIHMNHHDLENLIIHELFHIYSRNNLLKREKLYNLVGFHKCPELSLPDELKNLKITNPDAAINNYYIEVNHHGETIKTIPILYANNYYDASDKKEFFAYLQFQLLAVNISNNNTLPVYRNHHLFMIDPMTNHSFFNQVGSNTNYLFHPEEILASNFVFLINQDKNLKSPFVIEGMRKIILE